MCAFTWGTAASYKVAAVTYTGTTWTQASHSSDYTNDRK